MINRVRKYTDPDNLVEDHQENFRYSVAVTKPYKGTRNNPTPFHFYNVMAHIINTYDVIVSSGGYEADDEICIYQTNNEDTIICSRDKDLRMCPGWHYSWECGKQASVGPHYTDKFGMLGKSYSDKTLGYGTKFFYYQMLAGDSADNIPGLPKVGDVKAYKALVDVETEYECFKIVQSMYKEKMGESARGYFEEQASLLWMRQQKGVGFIPPSK